MTEVWKPLKENGAFEISNLGRIRSLSRYTSEKDKKFYLIPGRVYKQRVTPNGYCQACLRINKSYKYFYIHRLVAEYFIGNLTDGLEINHIDGNKLNNKVSNLEIVSRQENAKHAKETKLYSSGESHGLTRLNENQVRAIRELSKRGTSNKEIATMFKLTTKYVWAITTYRTWKYLEDTNV